MTTARDVIVQKLASWLYVSDAKRAADEVIAALLSAPDSVRLELAELLNPWRPIETAPKDGSRILAYSDDEADDLTPQIAKWQKAERKWVIAWDHDEINPPPTHWQLLPAPPSEDKPK